MTEKKLLVVGSFTTDFNIRVPHFPQPGETIAGSQFSTNPGGKGANQAYGAAKLGGQVKMIGCLGADYFGQVIIENMQSVGVDMAGVKSIPGVASGIAMIDIDDVGQNAISLAPNANSELTFDMVKEGWQTYQGDFDIILMQFETPYEVMKQTAKLGKEQGKLVIVNPAPAREIDAEFLAAIDILAPNETETSILTGMPVGTRDECVAAAKHLQEMGIRHVILTLGERGSLVLDAAGQVEFVEPFPIKAVDTTGAGDAFLASFCVALAGRASLVEAARQGNAAGALNATKLGAQGGLPTQAELAAFLAERG